MDQRVAPTASALLALGLSAALFYFGKPLPVALAGLACFAVFAWVRLDLALGIVLVAVPYFMRPKHLGHAEFAPSEVLLLVAAGVGALAVARDWHANVGAVGAADRASTQQERRCSLPTLPTPLGRLLRTGPRVAWQPLLTSPFLVPATLLFAAAILSTAVAAERHLALRELREVVIEPLLYFGLLLVFVRPQRHGREGVPLWLGLVLVLTGVLPAVIGLVQYVSHQDLVSVAGASYHRIKAWYGSPDNLGLLFDRTIPMCLGLGLFALGASRGAGLTRVRESHGWLFLVALGVSAILMLVALFLTYSRGAWVAVAAAVLAILTLRFNWGRWLTVATVVLVVLGLIGASHRIETAFQAGHSGTMQQRLNLWRSSIHMIRDHPLFGVGPDNFLHYYAPQHQRYIQCAHGLGYMEPAAWREPCLSHPHNEVLDFWLSTGILGLMSFVWLELIFWRLLWRWRPSLRSGSPLLLGVAGAMLASLVHGLIDNVYFLTDLAMLFWFLLALISLEDFARRGHALEEPPTAAARRRKPIESTFTPAGT